ncbi:protein FAM133-like [Mercenaria mercenaria]|uniref:protein FAM133-like n=1 Tax=Mercenaria mercenaria TaxID=6596 RepID=UPI00234E6C39|nr:protein FAM133-like [Mercenaria mercenaria]
MSQNWNRWGKKSSSISLIEELDSDGEDADTVKMKNELESLEREEARLKMLREKEELRQKLKKKRAEVNALKGKSELFIDKQTSVKSEIVSEVMASKLNVNDLRQSKKLRKAARIEVQKLGIFSSTESDTSSDSTSDSDSTSTTLDSDDDKDNEQDHDNNVSKSKKKKRKNKHKKSSRLSGIAMKSSDRVKNKQRYPHAQLRYEFVSCHVSF